MLPLVPAKRVGDCVPVMCAESVSSTGSDDQAESRCTLWVGVLTPCIRPRQSSTDEVENVAGLASK
jgi:hypothetical protein